MIGRDSREDMDGFGPWPWIGGFILAGIVIAMMFGLAQPISS